MADGGLQTGCLSSWDTLFDCRVCVCVCVCVWKTQAQTDTSFDSTLLVCSIRFHLFINANVSIAFNFHQSAKWSFMTMMPAFHFLCFFFFYAHTVCIVFSNVRGSSYTVSALQGWRLDRGEGAKAKSKTRKKLSSSLPELWTLWQRAQTWPEKSVSWLWDTNERYKNKPQKKTLSHWQQVSLQKCDRKTKCSEASRNKKLTILPAGEITV